MSPAYCCY